MQTTYKEQIEAIKIMRALLNNQGTISIDPVKLDLALNDAASTIAAIKWAEAANAPTASQKGLQP